MMTLLDRYPPGQPNPDDLDCTLTAHMDAHLTQLRADMATVVHAVGPALPDQDAELLFAEYARWSTTHSGGLINAADPCGT
jgi:xanthine/CO dehydrogenase XdhC/CoxF family maturation factor